MKFVTPSFDKTRKLQVSVGGIRIISLIIPFICLPFILANVGSHVLGQFYLIYSVILILGIFDLGIPNAVLSQMAQITENLDAKNEEERIVRDSIYRLMTVGIVACVIGSLATLLFPLTQVFNLKQSDTQVFKVSLIVSLVALFLKFLGNLGLKLLAFRNKYRTSQILENLSMSAGYLLTVATSCYWKNLLGVTLTLILCPAIIVLTFTYKELKFSVKRKISDHNFMKIQSLNLDKLHLLFIYLQFTTIVMVQVDSLIVGGLLTTSQVSTLNLCWKFFSIPYLVIVSVYGYIWVDAAKITVLPRATEFFNQIMSISKKLFFVCSFLAIIFLIAGQRIVAVWTAEIQPTRLFCLASGIWLCMLCFAYPITMMLNGMKFSRYLMITATLNMFVNVIGSLLFTTVLKDPAGVLFGSALGQLVGFYIPYYLYFIRHNGFRNRFKNVG